MIIGEHKPSQLMLADQADFVPHNSQTPKFASILDPVKSVKENDSREENSSSPEDVQFFFKGT